MLLKLAYIFVLLIVTRIKNKNKNDNAWLTQWSSPITYFPIDGVVVFMVLTEGVGG